MFKGKYSKGDVVVVLGGTVDSSGVINTSISLCTVNEVGEDDLLVSIIRGSSSVPLIVSKKICVPIDIASLTLTSGLPRRPCIGDMVFFQGKLSWRDESPTSIVGTIYEIQYVNSQPTVAKVLYSDEMIDLSYASLMVLQSNNKE